MSATSNLRATFYKDENKNDLVKISLIGDPNTVILDVKNNGDQLKKDFPIQWAEYYKNTKKIKQKETDLNVLECMTSNKIKALELEGITSVEQLSELSDGACHGLGKGTLDYRKEAKAFMMEKHNIKPLQVVGS